MSRPMWRVDTAGQAALFAAIAGGMADFADDVAREVRVLAPVGETRKYRRSIKATTYLNERVVSGEPVRGAGRLRRATIRSVVYTTDFRGHLLEFGTQAHVIPIHVPAGEHGMITTIRVRHPGARRKPHFWPGLAVASRNAGPTIAAGIARRGGGKRGARFTGGFVNTKELR